MSYDTLFDVFSNIFTVSYQYHRLKFKYSTNTLTSELVKDAYFHNKAINDDRDDIIYPGYNYVVALPREYVNYFLLLGYDYIADSREEKTFIDNNTLYVKDFINVDNELPF